MPGGNGISGVRGDAIYNTGGTQISEVKKFSWNPSQETKDYASNKTGGAKKRVSSVRDGSGSLDGVWDPWDPITDHMEPGTEVVLKLQHYTNQFWLVPAIIDDMSFECDIETGDVQTWTANFSLNGPWTIPVALPSTTTTTTAGFLGEFSNAQEMRMPKADGTTQAVPQSEPQSPFGNPHIGGQETPAGWPVWKGQRDAQPQRQNADAQRAAPQPQQAQPQGQQSPHGPSMPGMSPDVIDMIAQRVAQILGAGRQG
jgi:hypothetical protein